MTVTVDVQRAVMRSNLPAPARHIVHLLCALADYRTGVVPEHLCPSLTELAKMTGQARSSVAKYLNVIEDAKWAGRDRPPEELARSLKAHTTYRVQVGRRLTNDELAALSGKSSSPRGGLVRETDQPNPDNSTSPRGGLVRETDSTSPGDGRVPYSPTVSTTPPTPQDPEPVVNDPDPGEGEEADRDRLIDQILEIRPEWGARSIKRILTDPEITARPWPIVASALLAVARDPASTAPGRVRADGPWWSAAARTAMPRAPSLPPPCGQCGPNRLVDLGDQMARCPRCHPLAATA